MKRLLAVLVIPVLLSLGSSHAETIANYPGGAAANGIGGSRHNLGTASPFAKTNGTTEICVFCHTPHHTNTANNLKPLWNRVTQAPITYTAYGTTIGGTTIANIDIGSTTLACLSCHDGITTLDNIINAPGKDLNTGFSDAGMPNKVGECVNMIYDCNNAMWAIGGGYIAHGMIKRCLELDEDGNEIRTEYLPGTNDPIVWYHPDSTKSSSCSIGPWIIAGGGGLDLGTDLSNDHPVSVVYDPNNRGLRPIETPIASIDLMSDLAASAGEAYGGNLAQNRWAVNGFIDSGSARISDLLRDGKVECSSCHDPHFSNKSFDEIEGKGGYEGLPENRMDGLFLRRVGGNTGSGICRTCHNK